MTVLTQFFLQNVFFICITRPQKFLGRDSVRFTPSETVFFLNPWVQLEFYKNCGSISKIAAPAFEMMMNSRVAWLKQIVISRNSVGAPNFWKAGKSRTPYKKRLFSVGKRKKMLPKFFGGFGIHIRNTFCKKIGSKRPFEPSAMVRAIYRRLYGVATAN